MPVLDQTVRTPRVLPDRARLHRRASPAARLSPFPELHRIDRGIPAGIPLTRPLGLVPLADDIASLVVGALRRKIACNYKDIQDFTARVRSLPSSAGDGSSDY
jgi:hypothetical protein